MNIPTLEQIKEEGLRLAAAIGGGVHLHAVDLAHTVDASFPGMSDAEMAGVREQCATVTSEIRSASLAKLWSQ